MGAWDVVETARAVSQPPDSVVERTASSQQHIYRPQGERGARSRGRDRAPFISLYGFSIAGPDHLAAQVTTELTTPPSIQ